MNRFWKIANLIVLVFLISICVTGTFFKQIAFGWGLGDVFWYLILYALTLTHLILTIAFRNRGNILFKYLTIVFLTITVYISLKATIWRGGEYSWDGSIFYLPCPTEISIKNKDINKTLRIQMCSMEYYSEFTAIWSGQQMEFLEGELKIPDELKSYLKYPIVKILIQSNSFSRIKNGKTTKFYYFNNDTLKINNEYKISGEIIKIINNKPMFKVKLRK